jgi:type IV pilus assembly protein PilV
MRRDGFTIVEVVVALGVMTIGALALVGMQQQTTRANVRARELTVASQIAQNVIERLKLESLAWNTATQTPATDLFNAPLLQPASNNAAAGFITLPQRPSDSAGARVLSNAFDYFGQDVDLTTASAAQLAQVRFCASYRLTWVFDNQRALRADVRVWWSKEAPTRAILSDFAGCQDDNSLNPLGTHDGQYHLVYLSTVLRPGGAT